MRARTRAAVLTAVGLVAVSSLGQGLGDLLVTPTRLSLDDSGRSGSITVVNKGSKVVRYRLNLVDMVMTEDGILQRSASATSNSAAPLLRLSPREIVLEPGAAQRIKILAVVGPEMPDGEWRSHLSFEPILVNQAPQDGANGALRLSLETRAVLTMPVIVDHGRVSASVTLSDAKVSSDGPHWFATVRIGREGNRTVRGDLTATFIDSATGARTVIANVTALPVYFPNAARTLRLALSNDPSSLGKGEIEFKFAESDRPRGGASATVVVPAPG